MKVPYKKHVPPHQLLNLRGPSLQKQCKPWWAWEIYPSPAHSLSCCVTYRRDPWIGRRTYGISVTLRTSNSDFHGCLQVWPTRRLALILWCYQRWAVLHLCCQQWGNQISGFETIVHPKNECFAIYALSYNFQNTTQFHKCWTCILNLNKMKTKDVQITWATLHSQYNIENIKKKITLRNVTLLSTKIEPHFKFDAF